MASNTADEFIEDHKHIFDEALNLRSCGDHVKANQLYYLLNTIVDKCKIIDALSNDKKYRWSK